MHGFHPPGCSFEGGLQAIFSTISSSACDSVLFFLCVFLCVYVCVCVYMVGVAVANDNGEVIMMWLKTHACSFGAYQAIFQYIPCWMPDGSYGLFLVQSYVNNSSAITVSQEFTVLFPPFPSRAFHERREENGSTRCCCWHPHVGWSRDIWVWTQVCAP